jgi:hypothetical protein
LRASHCTVPDTARRPYHTPTTERRPDACGPPLGECLRKRSRQFRGAMGTMMWAYAVPGYITYGPPEWGSVEKPS